MSGGVKVDRWNLVQELFARALELPAAARVEYLSRACGDDQELRSEVASLLENDGEDTSALRSALAADLNAWAQAQTSAAGQRVGPYRLVRELDGGGMGIVYLAVRSDEHYFQIVAVKMLRPGFASPDLVQRFRTERQILATLSHPNIGAILDGGDTEDGRPFIVMEYVEGQPITQASQAEGWSIRRRIELFCSICSAVHYAHQKSVVHRDIKPSNVLVTPAGVVKLIDFGISKPLDPDLIPGEHTPTQTYQRLMTPDYASPEQILGRKLTTSTDIYSLGVVLFELLTDSRPYTLRDLSPAAAEQLVCDRETRRPSSVRELSAQSRRELAGDLDRIVLMAMNKDPAGRYASAQDLEEDLRRFLRGDPVLARQPTLLYRTGKFVRRHRTAALIAIIGVVVLGGLIAAYSWQLRSAERRVERFRRTTDSAISDLADKLQHSSASVETQASLFHSTLKYLQELRKESRDDPQLLLSLARAYERVGELEGSPTEANLGNSATAVDSYREALRAALAAHAQRPAEESAQVIVDAYQRLGGIESFLGRAAAAQADYGQSLTFARGFWQRSPDDPVRKRLLASAYLGIASSQLDDLEAGRALQSVRAAFQVFGNQTNGHDDHDRLLYRLYWNLARALMELGPASEALSSRRSTVAVAEEVARRDAGSPRNRRLLFAAYQGMAVFLAGRETAGMGDPKTAELYARKAVDITEALGADDRNNAQARNDLAFAYQAMGDALRLTRPASAAQWYRQAIALTREMAPRYPTGSQIQQEIAYRDEALAGVLSHPNESLELRQALQEANDIWKQLLAVSPHSRENQMYLMRSYCRLSDLELGAGDLAGARRYADLALPFLKNFTPDSPSLFILRHVGLCYESLGNVQRWIALNRSFAASEREVARDEARRWYLQSARALAQWSTRFGRTAENDAERSRVENSLQAVR